MDRKTPNHGAIPGPVHYAIATIFFLSFAAYGSLVPLEIEQIGLEEAVSRFADELSQIGDVFTLAAWRIRRVDASVNVLLFIPVAFCAAGMILADRSGWLRRLAAIAIVFPLCAVSSLTIEFAQEWVPSRVPSVRDVVAQGIGAGIGMLIWAACGQQLTASMRSFLASSRRATGVDWLLRAYFVGLVVYSLLPFDLTLHPQDLYHKLHEGRVILRPFGGRTLSAATLWQLFFDALVYVPVGALCTRYTAGPKGSVKPIVDSALWGTLVVVGIEMSQLFVMSRYSETTDVLTGALGVTLGAVLFRPRHQRFIQVGSHDDHKGRIISWLSPTVLYALFLCWLFWSPFDWMTNSDDVRQKLAGYWAVPFLRLQQGSEMNAASNIIEKVGFFSVLGFLMAGSIAAMPMPRWLRPFCIVAVAICAIIFAVGIEAVQAATASHYPDITDTMLYIAGTVLGACVAVKLRVGSQFRRSPAGSPANISYRNTNGRHRS